MKKTARIFAIAVIVLAALCALAVLGLNVYVRFPATQSRIEEKVSQRAGMPVKITGASFTPWGGLRLKSARVLRTDSNAQSQNFLETNGIVARFKILPLLSGRIEVTSVDVSSPKVVWEQNRRGKWRLPSLAKRPATPAAAPAISATPAQETKPGNPASTVENPPKPKTQFTIDRFRIAGGAFDFLDAKQARIASFTGLELDASTITADTASGTARCPATSVADVVFPKNLRTAFVYKDGALEMKNLDADLAGGKIGGNFKIEVNKPDSPYLADVRLENVDVNRLIMEAGGRPGQVTGTLDGKLDMNGTTRGTEAIGGSGRVTLRNGHIRENPILQIIGQVLQIDELARLELSAAQTDFRIADGKIWVEPLVLESANLKLTVRGTIRLADNKIASEARLDVNKKIADKIPSLIAKQLKHAESGDGSYIDFALKGTVDKPKTDLAERLIGDKIEKEIADFLSAFGVKKKDKDDKKTPKKKERAPDDAAPVNPLRVPEAGQ